MKRILALDGGGIRGVFSIAILERMEAILRERFAGDRDGYVLADYFDFIGGTSTGAIIASMLSKGMSMRAVRESYEQLGPIVFRRKPLWKSWRAFYGSEAFATLLKDIFAEAPHEAMTLGSKKLRTLLLVAMRNGSTGSTWTITNHPDAPYNRRRKNGVPTNLDIPLWQLIRASAAAPGYFPTELVTLYSDEGDVQQFEFIDGGVSPYNNPSVAMYLSATLPAFGINMPRGEGELYLCSVGTGALPERYAPGQLGRVNVVGGALRALRGLMESVRVEQDKICRVLGRTLHGATIDSEIGDLKGAGMGQFLYTRYQHQFTDAEIERCRRETGSKKPLELDDVASVGTLLRIGREYADATVRPDHLP